MLLAASLACGHSAATGRDAADGDAANGDEPIDVSSVEAEPWPEADALFHTDSRWLGADGAYSVPLEGERVLWLFGDTFVATSDEGSRSQSRMVRNTVAIQRGLCPTGADIDFYWREQDGLPASFFAEEGEHWFWPLHGIGLEGTVTLFLLREAPTDEGLGFEAVGWEALRVDDPTAEPTDWSLRRLPGFDVPFPVAVGTSVMATEGHVLAYAVQEPGAHDVYLLRWPREAFVEGDLRSPEWWDGEWRPHADVGGAPRPVFRDGQTELTVSHEPKWGSYVEVQTVGFGSTTIGIRAAPAPEGSWTSPISIFEPPESERSDTLVYAAKHHPGLRCDDSPESLSITYASNAQDFETLVEDTSLYYPRFVRASPR